MYTNTDLYKKTASHVNEGLITNFVNIYTSTGDVPGCSVGYSGAVIFVHGLTAYTRTSLCLLCRVCLCTLTAC